MESPSPELGWLVYLALTGSSMESTTVDGGVGIGSVAAGTGVGAEVGVVAPARLLDDEAFFVHFFGRLTRGRGGTDIPTGPPLPPPVGEGGGGDRDGDGDGPDARILEEVNVFFSHHHNMNT